MKQTNKGRYELKVLTTLWVVCMFLMPAALADDVDDVKAALQRYTTALNAGDANAWIPLHAAGNTRFGPGGTLLEKYNSLEERRKNQQAEFDSGVKYNIQSRHLEISVYGDTAVTTSYGVGRLTFPDGTTIQVNNRITRVWIKQGGQWKAVHNHRSPLFPR